jgi:Spy/CpxP family protein refolding chaperone
MLRFAFRLVICGLWVSILSSLAAAQGVPLPKNPAPPPPGQSPGPGRVERQGTWIELGAGPLGILSIDQVQQELRLTAEQREKLKTLGQQIRDEVRKQVEELPGLSPEVRQARLAEIIAKSRLTADSVRKQVLDSLQPEQQARLREVTIQLRGPIALADEEIARALNLTEQQRAEIKAIRESALEGVRSLTAPLREKHEAPTPELEAKAADLQRQAVEQSLGVLTPEQKESLEKMQGEKVQWERTRPRPWLRGLLGLPLRDQERQPPPAPPASVQ